MNDTYLRTSLLDLHHALGPVARGVLLAGGYGLYLKQLYLSESDERTLIRADLWPAPRATQDLDLMLSTDIVADAEAMGAVRTALDGLGYEVIESAKYLQFVRRISEVQVVKIDLLAAQRDVLEAHPDIQADVRRARPVSGNRPNLHAHPTDGAISIGPSRVLLPVTGTLSSGQVFTTMVAVPCPFDYLLMKLTAYRDRRDDRDKDLGRHHALDVFRVVAMLTESERDEVQAQLRVYSANPQVDSCARLVRADFLTKSASAVLAMREHHCGTTTINSRCSSKCSPSCSRSAATRRRHGRVGRARGHVGRARRRRPGRRDRRLLRQDHATGTDRGDIETVVAKALSREKERRYESAAQFAEDLRRHLRDEPILARPATTIYQLRKLARRHRPLVVGGLLAAVGLLCGAVFATWQATVATRQRDRALVAERQAREVSRFLQDMLATADPNRSPDTDVTVVEVLDAAAATLADRFADDPPVELAVRMTLAESYDSLGRHAEAETQVERVLAVARAEFGDLDPQTLNALSFLALTARGQGRQAEAESLATLAHDGFARAHGPEHPDAISATNNLALTLIDRGDYARAEELLRECVATSVRLRGEDDEKSLDYVANLASVLSSQGRNEEAEPLLLQGYGLLSEALGPQNDRTQIAAAALATLYQNWGRPTEAVAWRARRT